MKTTLGLRIDVDTYRGTRLGVPNLCRLFSRHGLFATFFFSVGPDNMGRHILRVFRPAFLKKMLRSRAPSLYGWDILLKGTLWSGPVIGERLARVISNASDLGHEIGLHAWDHHAWQAKIDKMDTKQIHAHLKKGCDMIEHITGNPPACSAAPAWKSTDAALLAKKEFPFAYNSDCRGEAIFMPRVSGHEITQPQIPATLPTYDEIIGEGGVTDENYNDYIFSLVRPERLNVLTIHAEVEGISRYNLFADFLEKALQKKFAVVPLGRLLDAKPPIGTAKMVQKHLPGRDGWLSVQETEA